MDPGIRLLVAALGALGGAAVGLASGVAVPLVICSLHDRLTRPAGGSGWMTIGWVFCFVTAPAGAVACAVIAVRFLWRATS
jgi:hypothetical protein